MTEDAAVFGGLNNMLEGLENAYTLYKPKMSSCFDIILHGGSYRG